MQPLSSPNSRTLTTPKRNPVLPHSPCSLTHGNPYVVLCFWLLSLSAVFSRCIHIVMCQYFLPFYGSIIFHWTIYKTADPFISWWMFGLFLPFGYCKQCFYEHWSISFCVNLGIYLGVELLDHMVTLSLAFQEQPNCFP